MSVAPVNENQVLEALQHVPPERWKDVIAYIHVLQSGEAKNTESEPIRTASDLAGSALVGLWADRNDLPDTHSLAQQLAQHREGENHVAGQ